ncbi:MULTISPECIES: 2OG-Fe(II) oxygenase [Ramlibacter]|uniref:Proline hydroxylase n=1 Tax=Ramlibacter pinisoli TaxID=2682844 RepID=A0A6N8IXE3_9BURK|nr:MULTISPECIES: 2OG-Fe(II) oxygenase [Ramlibacter]MBA2961736.1 2OG-Fe(II) oxygenase [Ramlibacter sp. CGMCC 1.13660]MVQ31679.1 proline hydroxylase [Ramlibacter pinisoli]
MPTSHLELNPAPRAHRLVRASGLESHEWSRVDAELDRDGVAVLPQLLTPAECSDLAALYDNSGPGMFRSTVVMARHGFGRGEYKYFDYPLPGLVSELRTGLYGRLVGTANRWNALLGLEPAYPPSHAEYLERCHAAGQARATPLLLSYGSGDYNCLHQDLYGALVFPLQVVILLSAPGVAFDGGELVLTEQRPRMQSRPLVVPLRQGDAAVFAVSHRPVQGSRGFHRVNMRHGVSRIHSGTRRTLGLIFHDAA